MSAGNAFLVGGVFNISAFPTTSGLLGSGNYWIEEIDFVFTYVITNAANAAAVNFSLTLSPSPTVPWIQTFLVQSTAAQTIPYNIPITSRPRIFLPRSNTVNVLVSGGAAFITNLTFSINLYGRTLP